MKINFLGTSAGWPLPRLGCKCEICSSIDPKDTRTRSQILVNEELLLDIGPDTYNHLSSTRVDPSKIEYAAITHEHPDHTQGLWDLGHIYNSKKIEVLVGEPTYKKISNLFFYKQYKVRKVKPNQSIKIDKLMLTLLPVNHTDSSFGIFVQEEDKSIFYAPDFKSIPEETKLKINRVDLAILDGSSLKHLSPTHNPIEQNIQIGKNLEAKQVYFTHIGHITGKHDNLEKFAQKYGGPNFHIPYDDLELTI